MSVRLCDVLRFIQSTQSVSDLETIRDEVGFFLTLAERDWPSHMRGQGAHCATVPYKSCDSRLANGMPAGNVGVDKTGRYCTDESYKTTFATMWCDNEGGV